MKRTGKAKARLNQKQAFITVSVRRITSSALPQHEMPRLMKLKPGAEKLAESSPAGSSPSDVKPIGFPNDDEKH